MKGIVTTGPREFTPPMTMKMTEIDPKANSRVGETNLKSSDPNSEPQGITNYDIEVPCKILDHSDQFGPGPHPPLGGRG